MTNIINIKTLPLVGCKQGHVRLYDLVSNITPQSFDPIMNYDSTTLTEINKSKSKNVDNMHSNNFN